ncbi:MAG: hypothetical protein ACXWYT_10430, partial [Actinomycetota bacterium]
TVKLAELQPVDAPTVTARAHAPSRSFRRLIRRARERICGLRDRDESAAVNATTATRTKPL